MNYVSDMLIRLRSFYVWLTDNGHTTIDPFRQYKIGEIVYGTPIYITTEERKQLPISDMGGDRLKPYYRNVKSGDTDNREGAAAKIYWTELFGHEFVRSREGVPPNNLLNYGYTILRAAVARSLMGSGLFPAFGIFHRNRYNAFPLADDLMEPYRPYVDALVYKLYTQGASQLTKEVKGELLRILFADTRFDKVLRPLDVGLTFTSASLAKCFAGTQKRIAYPLLE